MNIILGEWETQVIVMTRQVRMTELSDHGSSFLKNNTKLFTLKISRLFTYIQVNAVQNIPKHSVIKLNAYVYLITQSSKLQLVKNGINLSLTCIV